MKKGTFSSEQEGRSQKYTDISQSNKNTVRDYASPMVQAPLIQGNTNGTRRAWGRDYASPWGT